MQIDYDKCFVPNWFEKHHIEKWLGESLTDDEWQDWLDENRYKLADLISEIVEEFVRESR